MKKPLIIILVVLVIAAAALVFLFSSGKADELLHKWSLFLTSCSSKNYVPYDCPPSVYWNDEIYYFFQADKIPSDSITEELVVGKVTSIIDISKMPDENGEANFPTAENAALAEYEGGLWMHHPDGYWYLLTLKSEAEAE